MTLLVSPSDSIRGTVKLPSSKSYSIRAFLIASCGGNSIIFNPSNCDDVKVSISAAKFLGARVVKLSKNTWKVLPDKKCKKTQVINVKESGTVLRFILPLLSLKGKKIKVTGEGTLKKRPNAHLIRTLRHMGACIQGKGKQQSVPIYIRGGTLNGGKIKIEGSLSSQFISALLIACPQLSEDTQLFITGKNVASKDYILMTHQVLKLCGIKIKKSGPRSFNIVGRQKFKGLNRFKVPSDYGLAAFSLAAAALTNSNIVLKGFLKDDLAQADRAILKLLRSMGARFEKTASFISIKGPFKLKGGDFSLKDCPDLVPIMSILALFSKGRTRLKNIQHARIKESNRISDLRHELLKIGANVKEKRDELIIYPRTNYRGNVKLDPYNDHRLAMAFCILGLKIGTQVKNVECVSKSYPDFVSDLKRLGAKVSRQ